MPAVNIHSGQTLYGFGGTFQSFVENRLKESQLGIQQFPVCMHGWMEEMWQSPQDSPFGVYLST